MTREEFIQETVDELVSWNEQRARLAGGTPAENFEQATTRSPEEGREYVAYRAREYGVTPDDNLFEDVTAATREALNN